MVLKTKDECFSIFKPLWRSMHSFPLRTFYTFLFHINLKTRTKLYLFINMFPSHSMEMCLFSFIISDLLDMAWTWCMTFGEQSESGMRRIVDECRFSTVMAKLSGPYDKFLVLPSGCFIPKQGTNKLTPFQLINIIQTNIVKIE